VEPARVFKVHERRFYGEKLMAHLGGAGIRPLGDEWNAKNLMAVLTGHAPGIGVGVFDILLLNPKQLFALRTFLDKHWHGSPLCCWYL